MAVDLSMKSDSNNNTAVDLSIKSSDDTRVPTCPSDDTRVPTCPLSVTCSENTLQIVEKLMLARHIQSLRKAIRIEKLISNGRYVSEITCFKLPT